MTGFPEWNFPAFDEARTRLRAAGFAVVCPAELDRSAGFDETDERREAWTVELGREAARRDARAISHVDAVAVLAGWEKSRGARVELELARWIGLPVVAAEDPSFDVTYTVDRFLAGRGGSESVRRGMLEEAAELVDGDRNASYGDPRQDFSRTASLWTVYLEGRTVIEPHDVAAMMALLKLSRIRWAPGKRDSWVDLAGYAACGWDCARDD
jgi:hypothetical protein